MSNRTDEALSRVMQAYVSATPPSPEPPSIHEPDAAAKWARPVFVAIGAFALVILMGAGLVLLLPLGGTNDPSSGVDVTVAPTVAPDAAPFITINADETNYPRPGDGTAGVAVSGGMLWVSAEAGIIRWDLERENAELFTSGNDLPFADDSSGSVAAAPDGTMWAISGYQDLALFDGARWAEPTGYDQLDIVNPRCDADEECLNPITAMTVGPDGLLSLAVGPETLIQYNGIDWSVLPVTASETHGDGASAWTMDMAVASDGTIWAASGEELLAYDGDSWDRFTAYDGLPSGRISSVAVAASGDVWVGTTDDFEGVPSGGVARFDGDTWTVFDETEGLHEKSVVALTVGPDGTVWAVHGDTSDMGSAGELATGGISRFDGAAWSATSVADAGIAFGWSGAAVDDTGTLWITSRWGVVGFDGSEATVLRFPAGTRLPINALSFTLPSQILSASDDPFEWRFDSLGSETSEVTGMQELVRGENCYGVGGDQRPSAVVEFNGGSIDFTLGYRSIPDIVVTDAVGNVTQVGNPFGELAWLCSVATTDTHILAVGSGVSWSEDGIAWHGIEAFERNVAWNVDGSILMWAAAGPGGYMVFGREGVVWFSEDLGTWYETRLENGYGTSVWGYVGPSGVSIKEEIVIAMFDEAWIGTRREG